MAQLNARAATSDQAPASAGRYSQAVSAGGFCLLAGQGPLDPVTAEPPPARTTIFSHFADFDVEIDAICLIP